MTEFRVRLDTCRGRIITAMRLLVVHLDAKSISYILPTSRRIGPQ